MTEHTTFPCDHHVQHRIQDTTIDGDDATDQWVCDECGETWTQTRGITFGEKADSLQNDIDETVSQLESEAERLRESGNETAAVVIEMIIESVTERSDDLAATRQKMPFGLDSAQGFGEVMENPTITFLEETQRDANSDDE